MPFQERGIPAAGFLAVWRRCHSRTEGGVQGKSRARRSRLARSVFSNEGMRSFGSQLSPQGSSQIRPTEIISKPHFPSGAQYWSGFRDPAWISARNLLLPMPFPSGPIQFQCAKCGSSLPVDGSAQMLTCNYCKAQTLLPEAIWLRFRPAPAAAAPPASPPAKGMGGIVVACLIVGGIVTAIVIAVVVGGTVASSPSAVPAPNPIAAPGEPCNARRAACSKDKRTQLSCGAQDKMLIAATCKGPNGCRVVDDGTSVSCDVTLADPKDPCDTTDDACSTDHKAELRCQAGHFNVIATCKGPDGCTLTPSKSGSGYTLSCDDHIADIGDPCFEASRTACSPDKKSLLACNAQRFVVDRACKKGCTVKKIAGTENKSMDCE
jgi:hypothetical protein